MICARTLTAGLLAGLALFPLASLGDGIQQTNPPQLLNPAAVQELSLPQCLAAAMENNHRRPASRFAVAIAEAQHRQALAAYWPQLSVKGSYQHADQAPDFLFPATSVQLPAGYSIPLNGPGGSSLPMTALTVPAQDVKLMDPDTFFASLNASWLLFDGGMRHGYRQQTRAFVDMMKQEARRTDLEIADAVKRYYYGSLLARLLLQVGHDTLARMEATLTLTETMYKEGSGKIKKTDFLDNKVMVESLRAMVAQLEKNQLLAEAALANAIGRSWDTSIRPPTKSSPTLPSPKTSTASSPPPTSSAPIGPRSTPPSAPPRGPSPPPAADYSPKLALTGDLHAFWNNYDAGLATDRNKAGWIVGFGIEIPVFNGFQTKNKVAEIRARLAKVKEEQFLLKEGIGLQVKDLFLSLNAAQKSFQATLDAMKSAEENRDLNTRAYQNELVETEKVIRAQLVEALMSAQHFKTRYDHLALQSQLNLLVGTEVIRRLEPAP